LSSTCRTSNNLKRHLWRDEIKIFRKSRGSERQLIQRANYYSLSDYKPKHNQQGQRLCVNCGNPITNRQKRKYCSENCSQEFFRHHNFAAMRTFIFYRDNFTCQKCKTDMNRHGRTDDPMSTYNAVVDHKRPIALGGEEFDESNLWLLCGPCNKEKTKQDQLVIAKKRKELRPIRLGNTFDVEGLSFLFGYKQFKDLLEFV
jgi:5-methylcytosine-specific restriction endonuclease McrA